MAQPGETLERVFREEYGRIIATLIRLSGSFDLAEESLQEAFAKAAASWEQDGLPRNPGAWLTTVAQRKLFDALRREKTKTEKQPELEYEIERLHPGNETSESALFGEALEQTDDRLRLIFTCCHPALNREAQIGLTLRTLGGLTTTEIARAFLLPEPTLAQRLVRAKSKIRIAQIPYEIPSLDALPERLASVRAVLYLVFNEGYSATTGENLIRRDLCGEAMRLTRVLCELLPDEPENLALLALMLLHDSRRSARINEKGALVTLEEQNRSLWDRQEIAEGTQLLAQALRMGTVGQYQIQAAIALVHAEAATAQQTNWAQIVVLYEELLHLIPSPVIALNHAAAVAMSEGLEKGLALVNEAGESGKLDNYYLFHAARADLFRRLGRRTDAVEAYKRALSLTRNQVEQEYMQRRLQEVAESNQ